MSVSVEVLASKLVSPMRITLFVPLLSPALSRLAQLSRALSSVAQLSPAISSVVCIVARLAFDVVVCVGRWLTWYYGMCRGMVCVVVWYVSWYGMCRGQALTFDVVVSCVGLRLSRSMSWAPVSVSSSCGTCVPCGTCGRFRDSIWLRADKPETFVGSSRLPGGVA